MSELPPVQRAELIRVLDYGDRALLVELDKLQAALAYYAALAAEPPRGVVDLVPAARTVLVQFDPAQLARETTRTWLQAVAARVTGDGASLLPGARRSETPPLEIGVRYDGVDLAEVARELDITPQEVIDRHTQREWLVAFGGFAPGFGYLVTADGSDSGLQLARHATPRTSVPAGSVALAGEFTGVYPRSSPGGWRLIGTTTAQLWEPHSAQAALLVPGTRVRFRALGESALEPSAGAVSSSIPPHLGTESTLAATTDSGANSANGASRASDANGANGANPATVTPSSATFTVLEAGPLTVIQDRGRPGNGAIGVSASGALDRAASALANRLLGNLAGAATLEIAIGGLAVRFDSEAWFALTGADGEATLDGVVIELDAANRAPAGSVLRVPIARAGLRYYLGVRGGIDAEMLLGSRSRDTLSSLGPEPLAPGEQLPIGPEPEAAIPLVPMNPAWPPSTDAVTVYLHPGPRADWLEPASLVRLYEQEWQISAQSNRVGARLEGEPLRRARTEELASEGMVAGAIQLPPSGLPTVLLADHPVTGGYPVVAVVADSSLDRFAQLRPGQTVHFRHAR